MGEKWYRGQKVICISKFDDIADGKKAVKPIKEGGLYTVSNFFVNLEENDIQIGLVIKNHWQIIGSKTDAMIYSSDGFMPFDLWIKNARAVENLLEEMKI